GCNGGSGSGQISTWLGGYTPDIVLVHLGTNDVIQCQSISSSVSELKQLIDVLRSDNPRVTVLLAKVIPMTRSFPCGSDNSDLTALNNQMAGIASDKSTAQSPVQVVDLNTGFNAGTDTYDGIHPNTSGEQKMANGWYAALQPILNNRVSLDLDMVLAAAFSGGQMTNTLNTSSLLPLSHPYTDSKYAGTDRFVAAAETVPSGWFGSRTDLVDWVVVQLKSSVFSAPVASRAAFVKRDGTVVDLDGESPVAFTAAPGTYYVAVAHRNHLPAVSATLVDLSSGSGAYDFTTASAFGTNALTTVGGQLALWAGDADGDTGVNARDAIYIQARLGSGYSDSDLDLNGSASVSDLTLIWPGSNGRPSGIPRTATKVELERMK
ncbi:MAG: SGNH/GDSL hydrolase family protein, partial [Bacteroidota bacterium]